MSVASNELLKRDFFIFPTMRENCVLDALRGHEFFQLEYCCI